MTYHLLNREREQACSRIESLQLGQKLENRNYTEAERKEIRGLLRRIEDIDEEIETRGLSPAQQNRPGAPAYTETGLTSSRFSGIGEFAVAVARASVPGGAVDPRLQQRAAAGMNEGIGSDGGFMVAAEQSDVLLRKVFETGVIARRVRRIPLTQPHTNGLAIPFIDETSRTTGNRLGGVRSYWGDEAGTLNASKPKIGKLEMTLKKLTALCYTTGELMDDVPAMDSILSEAFRKEMVYELEDKVLNGTGAGQPFGLMGAPSTIVVSKESGQPNGTIIYENVAKMLARLHPASWTNAVFLANVSTLPQLMRLAVPIKNVAGTENVGGAGLLFNSATRQLAGIPVLFVEQTKALGAKGDLVLVDLNEYLLIERAIKAASSIHVKFLTDEMAFRFIYRVDGQPAWTQAVSPANGSDTTSPCIVLEARS